MVGGPVNRRVLYIFGGPGPFFMDTPKFRLNPFFMDLPKPPDRV